MAGLQTEFAFTLPKGYVDGEGVLHRNGVMRLATARDEIEPLRDQRVTGADDPYLTILVISRVVTELGSLRQVTPREIEGLFAADLAFLQDLYGIINFGDPADVDALQRSVLPAVTEPQVAVAATNGGPTAEDAAQGTADSSEVASAITSADAPRASRARGQIEEVKTPADR
jgi:hypothetical protein